MENDRQKIADQAAELGNLLRELAPSWSDTVASMAVSIEDLTDDLTMEQSMAIQLRAKGKLEDLHRQLMITAATVNRLVKKLNVVPPDPEFPQEI